MSDFFQHGGIFLYFNLVCGTVAILGALRFATRPTQEALASVRALCIASLALGGLGSGSGLIKLMSTVGSLATPEDPHWALLFKGLSEVPHNALLGLAFCAVCSIVVAVGHFRTSR